jgi:hypothetical protein
MKSVARGRRISNVEITNLSNHGFWILIRDRELFVAFEHFPWFREAPVGDILDVEMQGPGHLYWPKLDVDLSVESIEKPEAFPLVSRVLPRALTRPARRKRPSARKPRIPRSR